MTVIHSHSRNGNEINNLTWKKMLSDSFADSGTIEFFYLLKTAVSQVCGGETAVNLAIEWSQVQ